MGVLKIHDGSVWQSINQFQIQEVLGNKSPGVSGDAGEGKTITLGTKFILPITYSGTINSVTIMSADGEAGTVEWDIWKRAGAKPGLADSIVNGHYPKLDSNTYFTDTDLSDWSSVTITAGDSIAFYIRSDTDLRKVVIVLDVTLI